MTYVSKFYKSASGHKAAKDRITIFFCSNASGDQGQVLINRKLGKKQVDFFMSEYEITRSLKRNAIQALSSSWKQNL